MYRIITVSREYGAGGGTLAGMLAKRLGWKLVDNSLVAEVAHRLRIDRETASRFDESVDPWFHRLVKALWHGGYEGVASSVNTDIVDSEGMAKIGGEVIREAALLGECVIVGRGSQCLLHRNPEAFHVSLFAPRRERAQRLRDRLPAGTDLDRAMREMDRRRAAYIQRYFGRDWKDRRLYHLVITSSLGLETVADAVLCAARLTARNS